MLSKLPVKQNRSLSLIFLAALAGIVTALVFLRSIPPYYGLERIGSSPYPDSFAFLGLPPKSLNELVNAADVIVVGTVGPIIEEGTFRGYENGEMVRATPTGDPNDGVIPFVDYELQVEQVLLDNGTIASGRSLVYRMPGENREGPVEQNKEYPMSAPGDHHLFFLTRNPDNKTYGLFHFNYSRLIIDGPTVTLSDGPRTELRLNGIERIPPREFLRAVRAVIAPRSN